MKKILPLLGFLAFIPVGVKAHCPLCTVGAGVLVVIGSWLGVSTTVIGILIGALAMALGLWFANLVKKKYLPFQKTIIALGVFILTVIPLMPLARDYDSVYISLFGNYGSIFHNTYMFNQFILGSVLGALAIILSPAVSKAVTKIRKKKIPFQGMIVTLFLIIVLSVIIEVIL